MSILSNAFGGGNNGQVNAMGAANQYLNQIPGKAHGAYDPYITQGKESGVNAHSAYEAMMKDPQAFINNLMSGYKTSDAYNYQSGKLGSAMSNTAAAGGIAGTPLDQMNQGEALQGLLSADQQQYLQNALGAYNRGLGGEEGEATRGYNATGSLNDIETGALNQQGGLAFNNAQQQNKNKNEMFQQVLKLIMAGGGAALGSFGGPAGAAAGWGIGSGLAGPMSGTTNAPWSNPG